MSDVRARMAFAVTSNNPVPVDEGSGFAPGTQVAATLWVQGAASQSPPLAQVCTPRTDHRWSRRAPAPFWVQAGDGSPLSSVRPAAADTFEVHGADGAPLARITYRGGRLLPWPRRARWSVRFSGTAQEVTGRAGTWYAWVVYIVTFPAWLVAAVVSIVYALLDGATDDACWGRPARTRWRRPGLGTVLDYRGISEVYRVDLQRLDPRIAYSLAVLHDWSRP